MRSRKISFVVTLVIIALAWLNYFEHEKLREAQRQVKLLSAKVHRLEALLDEARLPVIPDTVSQEKSRLNQGRNYQAAVEAFEKQIQDLPEAGRVEPPAFPPPNSAEVQAIQKMKQGSILRTRHRAASNMLDNALDELLDLPPETAERFRALVIERQAAANEYIVQLLSRDLTEGQRAELAEQAAAVVQPLDAAIAQTLGEELNQVYQDFEDVRMARIQHQLAVLAEKDADVPLNAVYEEQLLDLMVQQIQDYPSLQSTRTPQGFARVLQDPEIAFERTEDLATYHHEISQMTDGLLSPEQSAVLNANLQLQREMQESGLAILTQTVPGTE
ncbi:hypothetical protein [Desulfatibacillum aliphaticivorans]|uniref:hypothetical protein n=1 Tax=Desulfatibacillum aliphaticivorans TaxID=218208 RepID=UPI00041C77A7|nr:hypothetical protein [Desulfatibacillum aliphaticivorans]